MTSTLQRLLSAGVIHAGDGIAFHFKGNDFQAAVCAGGLISHCTWNSAPVLQDKIAFSTLTDWCDTCIQELLSEYVTRFSSWKRVRHVATGTPLSQLREKVRDDAVSDACNCAAVQCERRKVLQLELQVRDLQLQMQSQSSRAPSVFADDNPFRLRF
jgi:hypothetical protein